jgi:AAA domain
MIKMTFAKAVRKKSKLRLALCGPSGSGKTWGALQIAKGLGGKIACIDTEAGSASLYSHMADFDTLELAAPYAPDRYIAAIHEAEQAGYDVLIIDSASHEWNGKGGCLEMNENLAKARFKGNTWSAWSETTTRHREFIDAMLQSKMHIIATTRTKTDTAQVNENGKTKVVKLGMKSEQREGFEYEFTVVLDLVHDGHYATCSKDRTGLFNGDPRPIDIETGKILAAWLESGAEPAPEPVPLESMPLDEVEHLEKIAESIRTFLAVGDDVGAVERHKAEKEKLDADQQVALWRLFAAPERTAMNKAKEFLKQQKAGKDEA